MGRGDRTAEDSSREGRRSGNKKVGWILQRAVFTFEIPSDAGGGKRGEGGERASECAGGWVASTSAGAL